MKCVTPCVMSVFILMAWHDAVDAGVASGVDNQAPHEQAYEVVGEAFALEDQRLLYREFHQLGDNGLTQQVRYVSPQGELIAEKSLHYSDIRWQPSFQQIDHRHEEIIRVNVEHHDVHVDISSASSASATVLPRSEQLVIDAGFDAFVKSHWSTLLAGERLVFDFALPTRQRMVSLLIYKDTADHCPAAANRVCLKIAANNWLLRRFVEPLWLAYERQSRRLLSFQGVANLSDEQGRSQAVRIMYRYVEQSDRARPLAAVD